MTKKAVKQNILVWLMYFAVFLNGFEAAGYQTSLGNIGNEYALSKAGMGVLASVQLIAGLVSPFVFGPLADRFGKRKLLGVFFALEIAACAVLILSRGYVLFGVGIFFIGLSVSTIQYIAIAALADLFPISGGKKIGTVTGFYSFGAVAAPLVCGYYLNHNFSWKLLFILIGIAAAAEMAAVFSTDFSLQESTQQDSTAETINGAWHLSGLLLLCAVMFIYVGYENGFAFFVNSYISGVLKISHSYLALSLFWLAMIPSRVICGYLSRQNRLTLAAASIGAVIISLAVGLTKSGILAVILCFPLGFFCGAIYPSVLTRSIDFSGGKTATATGMITAATGFGGAFVTIITGVISQHLGLQRAVLSLTVFLAADIILAFILIVKRNPKSISGRTEAYTK